MNRENDRNAAFLRWRCASGGGLAHDKCALRVGTAGARACERPSSHDDSVIDISSRRRGSGKGRSKALRTGRVQRERVTSSHVARRFRRDGIVHRARNLARRSNVQRGRAVLERIVWVYAYGKARRSVEKTEGGNVELRGACSTGIGHRKRSDEIQPGAEAGASYQLRFPVSAGRGSDYTGGRIAAATD